MKISVCMDLDRIAAVVGMLTSFNSETAMEKAMLKFVVLPDGMLVIGPLLDHKNLYAIHMTREQTVDEAKALIEELWSTSGRDLIIGAGAVGQDGIITSWNSSGFNRTTPPSLRAEIEREVAALFATGVFDAR